MTEHTSNDFAREQMVSQQVRAWEVLSERVLDVLRSLPRERFVPAAYRDLAFADTEIPLPQGHFMLAPNVVGRILQTLELNGTERVLEIGSGSGFLTACLAKLAARVRSVEIVPELAALARSHLSIAEVSNADIVEGYGLQYRDDVQYDAIAITASLPEYDARFEQLLAPGGKLFVVVGDGQAMDARLIRRDAAGAVSVSSIFETVIEPLVNARRPESFRF